MFLMFTKLSKQWVNKITIPSFQKLSLTSCNYCMLHVITAASQASNIFALIFNYHIHIFQN